jgi:hypothetical protein
LHVELAVINAHVHSVHMHSAPMKWTLRKPSYTHPSCACKSSLRHEVKPSYTHTCIHTCTLVSAHVKQPRVRAHLAITRNHS